MSNKRRKTRKDQQPCDSGLLYSIACYLEVWSGKQSERAIKNFLQKNSKIFFFTSLYPGLWWSCVGHGGGIGCIRQGIIFRVWRRRRMKGTGGDAHMHLGTEEKELTKRNGAHYLFSDFLSKEEQLSVWCCLRMFWELTISTISCLLLNHMPRSSSSTTEEFYIQSLPNLKPL